MINHAWYIFLVSPLILQFSGTMKSLFPSLSILSFLWDHCFYVLDYATPIYTMQELVTLSPRAHIPS